MNKDKKLLFVLLSLLLICLPLQTPITVWLAKMFGHIYIWSSWKEIIILLCAGLALAYSLSDQDLRREITRHTYNKIALGYLALLVFYLLLHLNSSSTFVSFALHARFIVIFLIAQVVGWYRPESFRYFIQIIIALAVVSAVFGLLQVSVLPPNLLEKIGYDPPGINTSAIPPAIHQTSADSNIYRAQAGLRGPNALGAYFILPILVCLQLFLRSRDKRNLGYIAILISGLFVTYSRSAWLGLLLSLILGMLMFGKPRVRHIALYGIIFSVLLGLVMVFSLGQRNYFKSVILHQNDKISTTQSNDGHVKLTQKALAEVSGSPLGKGLGTAGPASALDGHARIAENYYLQVGQEMGWPGIALLVLLHAYLILALRRLAKDDDSGKVLLLSLIALSFTNLLLHTWTDEVVSISFWLLAGAWLSGRNIPAKSTIRFKDAVKHKSKSH